MKTGFSYREGNVETSANGIVTGRNRTTGHEITRTIQELYESACDAGGVYGPKNEPVNGQMTVGELLDWHADFKWSLD